MLRLHPRPTQLETLRVGPATRVLTNPPGDSDAAQVLEALVQRHRGRSSSDSPVVGPPLIHWLRTVAGKQNRMARPGLGRRLKFTGANRYRG